MRDFLVERVGAHADVDAGLAEGAYVDHSGRPWRADEPYRPNAFIWFHRRRRDEAEVPGGLPVLFRDDRIVVVDKPHFLATTPRGIHAAQSVVARLRVALDAPELVPAHRLDRLTAGVLLCTLDRRVRGAYAGTFADGSASKTYEAIAPDLDLDDPLTVRNRLVKERGRLQARVVPGEPNAETLIEQVERRGAWARYRLTPRTGKTHQLRVHLNDLGAPICGDPLYPEVLDIAPDDFSTPLQLIARTLEFPDPIDGTPRRFESRRRLVWPAAEASE